jgi:Zn-dependent peptidase ImmA (M78 family)
MTDVQRLSPPELLLWNHGFRKAEHIDLEGIALSKGARVVYRQLDGCSARLVTDGESAVISVEARHVEGRQRFSLGHELAHWIRDVKKSSFKCTNADIGPQNAEAVDVEASANVYASQLVLPDYMVAPWIVGRRMSLVTAKEMHDEFRTSVTASAIKLAKRSDAKACVICHGKTGRQWYVSSRHWPQDLYPKKELHHDTAAFDIVFKATTRMSNLRKEPADHWLVGSHEVFRMQVEVQSMGLPEEFALTMLTLPANR